MDTMSAIKEFVRNNNVDFNRAHFDKLPPADRIEILESLPEDSLDEDAFYELVIAYAEDDQGENILGRINEWDKNGKLKKYFAFGLEAYAESEGRPMEGYAKTYKKALEWYRYEANAPFVQLLTKHCEANFQKENKMPRSLIKSIEMYKNSQR